MELEQIQKQVDWLDDERRKDKDRIGLLEKQLAALEAMLTPLLQQSKDQASEITHLRAQLAHAEGFTEEIMQVRVEMKQQGEDIQKQARKREEELEKARRLELRALETSIAEMRKELEVLTELRRGMQARIDEESRLGRAIDEVRTRMETIRRSEEEYTRTIRLIDDGRRQDAKRLTDLQGEVSAMRKRLDDQRSKVEMATATLKKLETRVNEMAVIETERREAMSNFLETQALREVEREKLWKEWQNRFQIIETQTTDVETSIQTLENTHRLVKRSQQQVDELNQKIERRINEITEIQRLSEERFRQEWVTFKADDQKRWTNYTLTMEEQRGESQRFYERLSEKVTELEDTMQEIQDLLGQVSELDGKRLQSLLAMAHEWVAAYERSLGRAR
ncbi:MAG: hypothetical protein JXB15_08240 [Anaerolineales bacterium]|nr:hypothetical protein [Anaerolineales bacterium]